MSQGAEGDSDTQREQGGPARRTQPQNPEDWFAPCPGIKVGGAVDAG